NSSNEEPDSDHELNIDLADLVYTAPPSPPPVYQTLVIPLPLPPPLNPLNSPANMGDQALRDAATAITALTTALGTVSEQTLITVEPFL
ncbi:5315_t:CDS:1, partial [Cetraspora pellucida]